MTDDYDYQLKAEVVPGSDWVSVTKEEWIKAERAAGFRPTLWSGHPEYMTTCATGGFSNSQGISGRLVRAVPATDHVVGREALVREAIEAVWRCSLVIESSVRRGDGPIQYAEVLYALKLIKEVRAALSAPNVVGAIRERAIDIICKEAEELGYCEDDLAVFRRGDFDGDDLLALQAVERALAASDVGTDHKRAADRLKTSLGHEGVYIHDATAERAICAALSALEADHAD